MRALPRELLPLFSDPSFPRWGKEALLLAVGKDPVDALHVFRALATRWEQYVDALLPAYQEEKRQAPCQQ